MKKYVFIVVIVLQLLSFEVFAGETSLTGYATYWDGTGRLGESISGIGGGVRYRQKMLGLFSWDIRGGYVNFDDIDTSIIPIEGAIVVGIPFLIEPYVGIGGGYYIVDSDKNLYDDAPGVFGVAGLQLNLFVIGAMAEIRYNRVDMSANNEDLLDGLSVNAGIVIKW